MAYNPTYVADAPDRAEIDALPGKQLIEFGTNWCAHCQAAQGAIQAALADYPELAHFKIEDGPGRRLGRSYRVKLWPTLIFLRNGQEVARLVRPTDEQQIRDTLAGFIAG